MSFRHVKVYDTALFQIVHSMDFPAAILSLALPVSDLEHGMVTSLGYSLSICIQYLYLLITVFIGVLLAMQQTFLYSMVWLMTEWCG